MELIEDSGKGHAGKPILLRAGRSGCGGNQLAWSVR